MDRCLWPAAAFAALLLVTSLVPVPDGASAAVPALLGVALDKWVHAGSYGLLTGLVVWGRGRRDLLAVGTVVVLVVGYGAGIELLQALVPTRDLSLLDAVANTVGALAVGLALAVVDLAPLRKRWHSKE